MRHDLARTVTAGSCCGEDAILFYRIVSSLCDQGLYAVFPWIQPVRKSECVACIDGTLLEKSVTLASKHQYRLRDEGE